MAICPQHATYESRHLWAISSAQMPSLGLAAGESLKVAQQALADRLSAIAVPAKRLQAG